MNLKKKIGWTSRILSRPGATDLHAVILYVSESLFNYVLLYVNILRCISWLTMVYTNVVNVLFGGYKNLNSITCKIVVRTTWGYEKTFFLKLKVREIIYQCSWESLHCLMHPTEIKKKVKNSFFIVYKSIN